MKSQQKKRKKGREIMREAIPAGVPWRKWVKFRRMEMIAGTYRLVKEVQDSERDLADHQYTRDLLKDHKKRYVYYIGSTGQLQSMFWVAAAFVVLYAVVVVGWGMFTTL